MKNRRWLWQAAKSLVFFLQLGLSIVFPLALCVFGAVWLHQNRGWGDWVLPAGIVLGLVLGGYSFHDFAKYMRQEARTRPRTDWDDKPPKKP